MKSTEILPVNQFQKSKKVFMCIAMYTYINIFPASASNLCIV